MAAARYVDERGSARLADMRIQKPLYQQQQQQQHQTSPPVASAAAGSKQKHHHLHQQYKADDFGSGGGVASASDFFAPPPSGLKSNGAFNPSSELTMDEYARDAHFFFLTKACCIQKGSRRTTARLICPCRPRV